MMFKDFELKFPLSRTHCGMVMGNGNFGAMVWGTETLCITVNRADFWDHRGGELIIPGTTYEKLVHTAENEGTGKALEKAIPRDIFPEDTFKPQRLPMGRFEFHFKDNILPERAVLDYASGTVRIWLSNGYNVSLDLSLTSPVLLMHDPENLIKAISIKTAWDFPDSSDWLKQFGFSVAEQRHEPDITGWVQSCPADPSLAAACITLFEGYAIALTLGETNDKAWKEALACVESVDNTDLIRNNSSWWSRYWKDIPEIYLEEAWFERFFQYALYKFAAATHPGGCACTLQGPWQEEYKKAEWSGDYHFNVNVQQVYSLAFSTGKLEHLLPLFDMIESEQFMNSLKHNASVMFGVDDALWFTHALDDIGQQCGWLIPNAILDPACGAWTAQLYWNYYRYSGDTEFLQNRAFPFIRGVMCGINAMLEERDGKLSIPLAISAEYGCSNPDVGHGGRDPSYQLAAAHMLANYLLEASDILELEPEDIWFDIKKRLPEFCTVHDEKSEQHIAIWEGQDLDVCHRHHSHLAAIYPFETLTSPTAEQTEIIDNSLDHWILKGMGQWSEWCMPWASIIYTRAGMSDAPMSVLKLWKDIFVNEGLSTVYVPRSRGIIAHRRNDLKKPKESSEIMQLDGTMGAATAMLEMMVHQHGDTVYLFKGLPESYRNASFKNIHLPGGFIISAQRGRLVKIKSNSGGKIIIQSDKKLFPCTFEPGEENIYSLNNVSDELT